MYNKKTEVKEENTKSAISGRKRLRTDFQGLLQRILTKQGRIVHKSGFNNKKIKIKNSLKSNMKKDFIFNSTMVKADIF